MHTAASSPPESFLAVEAALSSLADPAQAAEMRAYMRDQFAFLGVSAPARREAVRTILARRPLDWPLVWALWDRPEREYLYVGVDHLRRIKVFPSVQLDSLKELITTHSWWDTVDPLAKVAGSALDDATVAGAASASEVLRAWATDDNLWVRRVAIICQLSRRDKVDPRLLTHAIQANLGSKEFFINKAIGWALRDYARTAPEWVRVFVDSHDLAPLSRREALKHLR